MWKAIARDRPGRRTPVNPAAFTISNVDPTTGSLFQEPSSGIASRVFPKFQPGLSLSMKSAAEIEAKSPVQVAPAVDVADAVVEIDGEVGVVVEVTSVSWFVVAAGTHW